MRNKRYIEKVRQKLHDNGTCKQALTIQISVILTLKIFLWCVMRFSQGCINNTLFSLIFHDFNS